MEESEKKLTVRLDDIKLGPTDCALVFNDNGTLEVLTPFGIDKDALNYQLMQTCIAHINKLVADNNLPEFKNKTIH
jgi:hypothetical protein